MPAERAGYTVTMFVVDVSPHMGATRSIELPDGVTLEITHLEWALQFVMMKVEEMIFNGRKTDQCGVILFGTDGTQNALNDKRGDYEHVTEYIPIGQPNGVTMARLAALQPSETTGDPIDGLIVAIEAQSVYLASKKTWTRKMVLLTNGEGPIEIQDWEDIASKVDDLGIHFNIIGVEFDDEEFEYEQEDKSEMKSENEKFYRKFTSKLPDNCYMGNLEYALQEITRPEVKQVKSALLGTILRLGDVENYPLDSLEISVKASKCTALARPKSWKRFGLREKEEEEDDGTPPPPQPDDDEDKVWVELQMRTEYVLPKDPEDEEEEDKDAMDVDKDDDEQKTTQPPVDLSQRIEKEELVRGFKYGSSYVPCPDGQFERLETKRGIEICAFFKSVAFRPELAMGEVQYIWADPSSPNQQVAMSSIIQAMLSADKHDPKRKDQSHYPYFAIARWCNKDGSDPKMGVLQPCRSEKVDYFLWVQMPFADDVRKYNFAPLEYLTNKRGERITKHPYIPTEDQLDAMDNFVDALDLMNAGEKNEAGEREPWFDPRLSYNPAIHRTKQALFHSAVVPDLTTHPSPPPHPELLKYFETPQRVLKKARSSIEECKTAFNVKEVPKRAPRTRKDEHVHAHDDDDEPLLLDQPPRPSSKSQAQSQSRFTQDQSRSQAGPSRLQSQSQSNGGIQRLQLSKNDHDSDGSVTEPESDEDAELLLNRKATAPVAPSSVKNGKPESARSARRKLPTPSPEADDRLEPGRIVGTTAPLKDFRKNISRGDMVSKAVEDLGWAVREIVVKPFAKRRYSEMMECLTELREVCLQEDEIEVWNSYLQELKATCLDDPGNPRFWEELSSHGPKMSLIGNSEAKRQGGKSNVSDAAAETFITQ